MVDLAARTLSRRRTAGTGRFRRLGGTIGFLCGFRFSVAVAVAFCGVIGCVKTATLENESAAADQFPDFFAAAFRAFSRWWIGEFLQLLENIATFSTFELINWHFFTPAYQEI